MRQTMASLPPPVAVVPPPTDPAADPASRRPGTGSAAGRTSDRDTAAERLAAAHLRLSATPTTPPGQYDLAIDGFQTFLKFFPRHMSADDAQLNIGNSLYNAGKYHEAVAEYQQVISDYPQTDSVPAAYYKLGLTYRR